MEKFIGYFRISTRHQLRQDDISLGIEAQKTAVNKFINNTGILIGEFLEIESGKNNDRPILEKAIRESEKTGATLLISHLSRLSREVGFLFQLKSRIENSGIKIRSLDIPNMDTLNLGIYGTIAQHERELTSTRTKNALAELKKIGKVLGTPANLTNEARLKGQITIKRNARENDRNRQAQAVIMACLSKGMTLRQTADYLNELNFRTRYGKSFMATSVMRLHNSNMSK
jgi:DNA invertase Pin-like site-specific DNA recombinase